MKNKLIFILFLFMTTGIFAQGLFTDKGKFSMGAGIGYLSNDKFSSLSYNIGTSLFGITDIGVSYFKALPSDMPKRPEGISANIDFYAKKSEKFGLVLNTAFGSVNYSSVIIGGISVYGKFGENNQSGLIIYPFFSLAGDLTSETIVGGVGLSIEKKLSEHMSVVATPAVALAELSQFGINFDFVIK